MAWSNIIGQSRIISSLRHAAADGRVAHGYCFWGTAGAGKDAVALELAKMMNCLVPRRDKDGLLEACDECKSCHQADKFEHPNIRFIFSLPAGKSAPADRDESPLFRLSDDQIKIIREQMELKASDHYHDIDIPNAAQIKIASIRDIKKNVTMSAVQSGMRVVIISEADQMTDEAANAFLKTLEEPHSNITLILTTSRREQLPQTILSRCQQLYFPVLPDDEIAAALVARRGVALEDARLMAAFGQGSYSRACDFLNEDMRRSRHDIIDALRAALKRSEYRSALLHHVETLSGEKDRTRMEIMLALLLLWLRDAYEMSVAGAAAVITNVDQRQSIERFAAAFPDAPFGDMAIAVEEAAEAVRRNVDRRLILLTVLLRCRYMLPQGNR
ncbi:DNA polymerase III subunit delta' [Ignavibacteria bacterium]|jgi:DNA polymerase-3 subunit delta'|nr:DNA polymerase III subunit [Bacteroidota bacterium]MCZ2132052.1 DNA polymerase III subunit [Bacteroidota bacterium]